LDRHEEANRKGSGADLIPEEQAVLESEELQRLHEQLEEKQQQQEETDTEDDKDSDQGQVYDKADVYGEGPVERLGAQRRRVSGRSRDLGRIDSHCRSDPQEKALGDVWGRVRARVQPHKRVVVVVVVFIASIFLWRRRPDRGTSPQTDLSNPLGTTAFLLHGPYRGGYDTDDDDVDVE
jgi:hypothetical protein